MSTHLSTRDLPRGCIATDRSGNPLVVWPDGRYGYDVEHVHTTPSSSTGPYEVRFTDLTASECDAFARLPANLRATVYHCTLTLRDSNYYDSAYIAADLIGTLVGKPDLKDMSL